MPAVLIPLDPDLMRASAKSAARSEGCSGLVAPLVDDAHTINIDTNAVISCGAEFILAGFVEVKIPVQRAEA